jgi:hypothetical protein
LGREWIRDGTGVSIYKKVTVRKTCEVCDGTGRLMESELQHTHFCNTRPIRRQVKAGPIPFRFDQTLGYMIFVALVGYATFLLFRENFAVSGWPKVTVAITASIILLFVINHFAAATRALRWSTLFFFLMIVCGGFALEFAR